MKRKRIKVKEFLEQIWPEPPEHEVEESCDRILQFARQELKKYDTSLWSLHGDGWSAPATTQLEFQVLSAVSELGERAELHSINRMVSGWAGRNTIVSVQSSLEDLEKRKLIKVRKVRSSDGKYQSFFDLLEDGDRAIRRAHAENKELVPAPRGLARDEA
jgi:hypothetical protein